MSQQVFEAITRALVDGESAALVTIIKTEGSTPQRVGAKMLVYADGRTVGTIGGGCYENDAFWKAREALETRRPVVASYELTDDFAEESGLVCGGQMELPTKYINYTHYHIFNLDLSRRLYNIAIDSSVS